MAASRSSWENKVMCFKITRSLTIIADQANLVQSSFKSTNQRNYSILRILLLYCSTELPRNCKQNESTELYDTLYGISSFTI